jgi:LCP family protein required for cell wall assembly
VAEVGESEKPEVQAQEEPGAAPEPGGTGFSRVLLWTVLGALVPGSGLIAAGRRWAGVVVLLAIGLGAGALAGFALLGNPLKKGLSLAFDPQLLLIVAVSAIVIAIAWAAVIVVTNWQLRRRSLLSTGQGVASWLLVAVLVVAIGLPAYEVSHYALIQRGVVTSDSIFQGNTDTGTDADSAAAKPNLTKADPWADKPRVNVLLIGSDAGEDRTGIRPDTMILASINTKTGNTVLFSLPRSLQRATFPVGTPGHDAWPDGYWCADQSCLLNAVWTWAEDAPGYQKYKNPGLKATEDVVSGVTGLKVDTYVMLNLRGFRDFVDAIGGLTVDVHERLPIGGDGNPLSPIYHVATGGYIEIGNNQHLSGYKALWFARSRWASDDYQRMQRQRCVIGDVVDQADPVKLARGFPKIAKTLKKNLSTGISTSDLSAWVDLSLRVQGAKVTSLPFTNKVINTVHPDIPAIHRLVSATIRDSNKSGTTPTATATASPTPTPSVTPTTKTTKGTKKKPKKPKVDATKAQDVSQVC